MTMWYRLSNAPKSLYTSVPFSYHHSIYFPDDYWYGNLTALAAWGAQGPVQVTYYLEATDTHSNTSPATFPTGAYVVSYYCVQ